jgi:hypothetical protein
MKKNDELQLNSVMTDLKL